MAILYLLAVVAGAGSAGSGLLLLLIWALTGTASSSLGFGAVAAGLVAAGIFYVARRASRANRDWYPGQYTFASWPISAGAAVRVTYELRRRNPIVAHPPLTVHLILKHRRHRRERADTFVTAERKTIAPTEEKEIEPVELTFELTVPEVWLAQPPADRKVLLQVSRFANNMSSAYPVELDVAER